MKLNKVLALALSGVMAVSMLAGCKGGSANGEQDDSSSKPAVSTDAVAVMNKLQSKVEFKENSTLDTILAAAMEKAKASEIDDATLETPALVKNGAVYTYVQAKLPNEYKVQTSAIDYGTVNGNGKEATKTVLYMLKAGAYDEDTALAIVANEMKMDSYYGTYGISGNPAKTYTIDYTGSVSIDTATATNEEGKTFNVYFVAVSVTQTPTEEKGN